MAPDIRLVPRSAERDAHVLAPHGPGDRPRDRGLAHARRAGEEEDLPLRVRGLARFLHVIFSRRFRRRGGRLRPRGRAGQLRGLLGLLARLPELPNRQEFQDAVLHVGKRVVILVQDPRGLLDVQVVFAAGVPGKLRDRLEVGPDDLGLHGLAPDARQTPPLPVHLLADVFGEIQPVELGPQLFQGFVLRALALPELFLDRLHLLAQVHLALPPAELLLDLGLDVFLRRQDLDLLLDVEQNPPQPILD